MLTEGNFDLETYLNKYRAQNELQVLEKEIDNDEDQVGLEIWISHDLPVQ